VPFSLLLHCALLCDDDLAVVVVRPPRCVREPKLDIVSVVDRHSDDVQQPGRGAVRSGQDGHLEPSSVQCRFVCYTDGPVGAQANSRGPLEPLAVLALLKNQLLAARAASVDISNVVSHGPAGLCQVGRKGSRVDCVLEVARRIV
jgi:hypothetical protein